MVGKTVDMSIFRRDSYTCQYCWWNGSETWHVVDHDVPQSRGGTDHPSNLVTACFRCNSQKGDKTGAEYRAWRVTYPSLANYGPF